MVAARVVLHVDLDYFYAQCEEREDPSIRGKPVVVCVYSGRTADSGAVSTANYVARRFGVQSGIPIVLAKRMLKGEDAVFLPVNRKLYEEVSNSIMNLLRGHADSFEQVSIDEAFLDVTKRVNGDFEEAGKLAQRVKAEIMAKEKLTCSVGVGPNKLVSKIAAGFRKPDGLTVVKPEDAEAFLAPLPVGKLYGVGKKTEKVMKKIGIETIGDLAKYNAEKLIETFGKTLGVYFHSAAKGIDEEPVQERGRAESISRIKTLKEDTRDLEVVLETVDRLCGEVHSRVVQQGLSFRSVGIMAVMTDMSVHSRTKTFENSTNELEALRSTAKELFERFLRQQAELEIRRVGVKASNFEESQKKQTRLVDFSGKT